MISINSAWLDIFGQESIFWIFSAYIEMEICSSRSDTMNESSGNLVPLILAGIHLVHKDFSFFYRQGNFIYLFHFIVLVEV